MIMVKEITFSLLYVKRKQMVAQPEKSQCKPWDVSGYEERNYLPASPQNSQDSDLSSISYANDSFFGRQLLMFWSP